MYTETAFMKLADQLDASLAAPQVQADFDAAFFGYAERIEVDSAGRIQLPKLHLDLTHLGANVVVVGARTHLEVRDRDTWLAGHAQRFEALPELAQQVNPTSKKAAGGAA